MHEHHPHHNNPKMSHALMAAHATFHCLLGCLIGEFAGLAIGTTLGLPVWQTMTLAIVLAFVTGLWMAARPLSVQAGISVAAALKIIWLGEAVSIGVMEAAMNTVDYMLGGMTSGLTSPAFYGALLAGAAAGFAAAWPVNWGMIAFNLKAGH
ncbi:MAG: DUF4396 domain-containing protein [Campylobacterales bacterium]